MQHAYESVLAGNPMYALQIELEASAVRSGVARYREQIKSAVARGEGGRTSAASAVTAGWFAEVRRAVVGLRRECAAGKASPGRMIYGPMCTQLTADVQSAVAIDALLGKVFQCAADGEALTWGSACHTVGRALIAELNLRTARSEDKARRLKRAMRRMTARQINWWSRKNLDDPIHEASLRYAWGDAILKILAWSCYVADSEGNPVRCFAKKCRPRKSPLVVVADQLFTNVDSWHRHIARCRPDHLPMVCEPMPWRRRDGKDGIIEGGRITTRYPLISRPTREQKAALRDASLDRVFQSLEDLGRVKLRNNRRVFEVVERMSAVGGVLDLPPAGDPPDPGHLPDDAAEDDLRSHRRVRGEWIETCRQNQGQRFTFHRSLDAAKLMMQVCDHWYLDYHLCYRGRFYPRSTIMAIQGKDVWRGMCEMGKPKEPGDEGFQAILLQAAGLYGNDKLSMTDRLAWAIDHHAKMCAAADDPEEHVDFWGKADGGDSAWQFLAACFAVRFPDAAARFPVSLDGTCSGLQHYACATLDPQTASVVNLTPSGEHDTPNDVYRIIASRVAATVALDAQKGHPHALRLAGLVDRKVCKPPVMTTVYGVRESGMRRQLFESLAPKILGVAVKDLSTEQWLEMSPIIDYVRRIVAASIRELCPRAMEAMDWIREVAGMAADRGKLLSWSQPVTGFPVVMRDVRTTESRIKMASGQHIVRTPSLADGVRKDKQMDGSAPNVIHTFDGAHIAALGGLCRVRGIDKVPNHDMGWTHAATRQGLRRAMLETMVDLYRADPFAELHRQWQVSVGADIPPPPPRGTFDLADILRSEYAFS
jgi:DNA-directed RNA polymerase